MNSAVSLTLNKRSLPKDYFLAGSSSVIRPDTTEAGDVPNINVRLCHDSGALHWHFLLPDLTNTRRLMPSSFHF